MPKDPWKYKRRKRRGRGGKLQQTNPIESPRLPDPDEPSTIVELISEMPQHISVKNEEVPGNNMCYPDTRFPHSTTLFPASGVECNSLQSLRESLKRISEDKLSYTINKKVKITDSVTELETFSDDDCVIIENSPQKVQLTDSTKTTEETDSDDCMIIEDFTPKVKVKVEVVDLADESKPIVPITCSPVKTSFLMNKKPNTCLSANGEARVKVETDEGNTEADRNYTIQEKITETNASRHADTTTHTIVLASEFDIENGVNQGVNGQVRVTNPVSVSALKNTTDVKISDNMLDEVPIPKEQNESCLVSDNSAPDSKFTPDFNQASLNIPDWPGNIPLLTENLPNDINKQQTKKMVKDWLSSCSASSEKAQENLICDGNSSHSVLLTDAGVKKEPEDINCREICFNSEKNHPINRSGMHSGDSQLYGPGEFRTTFLKYLNLNTKVDLLEIVKALFYLNNMLKVKENVVAAHRESERSPLQNIIKATTSLKCIEPSKNLPIEKNKSDIGQYLSNDFLRQILDKTKPV